MGGFFTISICLHLTQVVPRNFPDKAVENSDALPVWGARPGNFFALRQYLFTDLYAVDESVQDISIQRFYTGIPLGKVEEMSIGIAYLLRCGFRLPPASCGVRQLVNLNANFLTISSWMSSLSIPAMLSR